MNRNVSAGVLFLFVWLFPFTVFGSRTEYITRATWYGAEFHGKKMKNGERFNMYDSAIVAHRTYPMGTRLSVTYPATGKKSNQRTIEVVVKDRGPYGNNGATLDLSWKAAELLGCVEKGNAQVLVTRLSGP